ncbi:MAG: hypothetical protein ACT4OE_01210 [Sphingosinicella sp.]
MLGVTLLTGSVLTPASSVLIIVPGMLQEAGSDGLAAMLLAGIYSGIAVAAIAGRRSDATAHATFRMPFFPLAPLLTLTALAYVLCATALDPEEGQPSLVTTGLLIRASLAYYRLVLARHGPGRCAVLGRPSKPAAAGAAPHRP